ncbi:MAG: molybdopterin molybdochelatase [Bryobacterales bacterium]|nr:molybdopterin molybdochelatase [Bryobacterales bacterium]
MSAGGRVLAVPATADRDYPALDRSVRDGFAIRAADIPGPFKVSGEVRAGDAALVELHPGEAIEIMTGAPIPAGADSVVMIEHVTRDNGNIRHEQAATEGQFISRRGEEARAGQILVDAGKRLDYSDLAVLASAGRASVSVFAKPRVAILATGDELVDISAIPQSHQVRNSNVYSLACQVARAGGLPEVLPVARDQEQHTRELIERALTADLLLLSGGVSAGKYDVVERVMADLGAEFFFDRVKIQPGQPVVFGRVRDRFFFGLPGNPGSTMVTFEIFARAALELLAGQKESVLPFALGRLTEPFEHKPGLTRFLPARLTGLGDLARVPWKGSSDIPAISRANAFLVADADRERWNAGDTMPVLLK